MARWTVIARATPGPPLFPSPGILSLCTPSPTHLPSSFSRLVSFLYSPWFSAPFRARTYARCVLRFYPQRLRKHKGKGHHRLVIRSASGSGESDLVNGFPVTPNKLFMQEVVDIVLLSFFIFYLVMFPLLQFSSDSLFSFSWIEPWRRSDGRCGRKRWRKNLIFPYFFCSIFCYLKADCFSRLFRSCLRQLELNMERGLRHSEQMGL